MTAKKPLAKRTPVEIDNELADLYGQMMDASARMTGAIESAHHAANDKARWVSQTRKAWGMTDSDALDRAREVAEGKTSAMAWDVEYARKAIDRYDAAVDAVRAAFDAMRPLDEEFKRRPWTRFFKVTSSAGGHIHSSMRCSTCYASTRYGWLPDMSGQDEATALAELASAAAILCTVCYPMAPVEWTRKRPAADQCDGSGKGPEVGTFKRQGMSGYGRCKGCGTNQTVTTRGVVRAHKRPKS